MPSIRGQQSLANRSSRSTLEQIASDDETPIASIAFEDVGTQDTAGPAVRRSRREGKRKARDE